MDLSEQQLLDCTRRFGNQGCNGGFMDGCFEYAQRKGGLTTEVSLRRSPLRSFTRSCGLTELLRCVVSQAKYAYKGRQSLICWDFLTPAAKGTALSGYTDLQAKNEGEMKAATALQPLSVAVAAGNAQWQMYSSGILDSPSCGDDLDRT
jgi:hypothetical protein